MAKSYPLWQAAVMRRYGSLININPSEFTHLVTSTISMGNVLLLQVKAQYAAISYSCALDIF